MNLPAEVRFAIYKLILSDLHITPCPFSTIRGRTLHRPGIITLFGKRDRFALDAYRIAMTRLCHMSARILEENRINSALLQRAEHRRRVDREAQGLPPEPSSMDDARRVIASTQALHMQTVREVRRELDRLRAEGFIEAPSTTSASS